MTATTRLLPRALAALAISASVIGVAAAVSAFAAPAGPAGPARPAASSSGCQVHWFTHPWEPGSFGATVTVTSTRTVPNWQLQLRFAGSERVTDIPAGPVGWWTQSGPRVWISGIPELRDLPAGEPVSIPLVISGTPGPAPSFTLNGRGCSVSSSTAITTTTTTTTTTPTSRTSTSTTTTTSGYPYEGCSYTYRVLAQSASRFSATITIAQVGGLGIGNQVRWAFSGDQQVTEVSPSAAPSATWSQTGNQVDVTGFPSAQGHSLVFYATYSGSNDAPLWVGGATSCRGTFYPAPSPTTAYPTTTG